jgi:hypothetical protein
LTFDRRRSTLVALAAAAFGLAAAASAVAASSSLPGGSWSSPARFGGPWSLLAFTPQISFSAAGAAAISVELSDPAHPAGTSALLATATPQGKITLARRVPGAQAILDSAYTGNSLDLLAGTSPTGYACCSSAQAIQLTGASRFSRPHSLVSGLIGATLGGLVNITGGGMLAAVATTGGVWVAQAPKRGRFGPSGQLAADGEQPQTLAATGLANGNTTVAWTATDGVPGDPGPRSILIASGTRSRPPRGRVAAVTVSAGRQIDELALAPGGSFTTAAWLESWFDRGWNYHSEPVTEDLGRSAKPHVFAVGAGSAGRLAFAGDGAGDQVLAWASCDSSGSCSVRAATRAAHAGFGPAVLLGSVSPSQTPAVSIGPGGQPFVGWIDARGVVVAAGGPKAGSFAQPRLLSRTTLAADLALAAGPTGTAIAAWTQGSPFPALMGSFYRPGK